MPNLEQGFWNFKERPIERLKNVHRFKTLKIVKNEWVWKNAIYGTIEWKMTISVTVC